MPMTSKNIALAKAVLDGASISALAGKTGLHRSRIHQIAIDFCREHFLDCMLYDCDGKINNIKQLRQKWRDLLTP